MSRDKSPQARIALAEELWQLARTGPSEIAELMHTNDLAVEILRAGLDLYVQQTQSEEHKMLEEEQESILTFLQGLLHQLEEIPDALGDAEDILIDDAAMNLLYTSIENITKRIHQKTRALDPASGHFLEEDSKEEQEFAVRWTHTGKYEATYLVTAGNLEEAVAYVAEHQQELEPANVVPLSDDYRQFL